MWNYRVIRKKTDTGEETFQIHEVYYNEDGSIFAMSEKPEAPFGESVEELIEDLRRMIEDTALPVLNEKEIKFSPLQSPAEKNLSDDEISANHQCARRKR